MNTEARPVWGGRNVRAVVALGLIFAFLHFAGTSLGCALESSECAEGGVKATFGGRVFTNDGRPIPRVRVDVEFGSARQAGAPQPSAVTDASGRFCFRWPFEVGRISTKARISSLPRDPRFSDPRVLDPRFANPYEIQDRSPPFRPTSARIVVASPNRVLISGEPTVFVTHVRELNTAGDLPRGCPSASVQPPWHRVDDAARNWRSLVIYALAAAGALLLAASRLAREPTALRWAAVGTCASEFGFIALVWSGNL